MRRHRQRFPSRRSDDRGQSLVELALVIPIMVALLVAVADFGRIFATGVEIEAAARDAAETGANQYLANPPGGAALSSPAPAPGDPTYYDPLHLSIAKVVCAELRDLPNTTYQSSDQTCPSMPAVLVCVHDSEDPSCAVNPFGSGAAPAQCGDFASPPTNSQGGGSQRWVEVRICYHFTSILGLPLPPLGDYWLQRTRNFVIPCYFVAPLPTDATGGCG